MPDLPEPGARPDAWLPPRHPRRRVLGDGRSDCEVAVHRSFRGERVVARSAAGHRGRSAGALGRSRALGVPAPARVPGGGRSSLAQGPAPRPAVLGSVRRLRAGGRALHLLHDDLTDQRCHRDPARVLGAGHRAARRRAVHGAPLHVGASCGRRPVVSRDARSWSARSAGTGSSSRRKGSPGGSPRPGSSPSTR